MQSVHALLKLGTFSVLLALCACIQPSEVAGQTTRGTSRTSAKQTTPSKPVQQPTPSAQGGGETLELTTAENEQYQAALELFKNQDLQGALGKLRELCDGNPAARPPRVIAAFWYSQLQNPRAARIMLETATEEDPNDPEAYFSLAEIALNEGELTAAELLTTRGSALLAKYNANPNRKKSLSTKELTLKIAYSNARKRWSDVYTNVLAAIKATGETAELDAAGGAALFHQNQYSQAREMFARAEKLSPKALPADAAMSQLYASSGDLANSQKSLEAALKSHPQSTPVLVLSITNALMSNDLDQAWKLVQQLYQTDKSVDVLKTYGKVALFRSDYKRAEAAFQEAVRQSPLDTDASNGLALALCEQDDTEKGKRAAQYAAGNVQKQQNNRDFLATLGWVLYKTGQPNEALQVLQQSTADGQINAASAYYIAVILNDKGQGAEAKKFLEAALASTLPFAKREAAQRLLNQLNAAPQQ